MMNKTTKGLKLRTSYRLRWQLAVVHASVLLPAHLKGTRSVALIKFDLMCQRGLIPREVPPPPFQKRKGRGAAACVRPGREGMQFGYKMNE